jgi:hypothetical protein
VSHIPERKEKDCLNCGTIVQGRYCHVCGQENVVPKESFWHTVTHFFYDIMHFDTKFFITLKDLLFRPGFLSKEYMLGRRASYLHPIKMYVFTSAIFFLIFFSFFKNEATVKTNSNLPLSNKERADIIREMEKKLSKDKKDSLFMQQLAFIKDTSRPVTVKDIPGKGDFISFTGTHYSSFEEYDSIQKTLPSSKRDGWFVRRVVKKQIQINERFHEDPDEALKEFLDNVLHRLPYMLFISLPLFALILKLVYIRRKQFYYVDHGIFTIHLYIFSFILLLVVFGLNALKKLTGLGIIDWIVGFLFVGLLFYLYKGMRNFYGQRRAKTFLKFIFVAFFSFIMMLILLLAFIFLSAFTF